jgi:TrmH family RNA methyltransferase
LRVSTRNARFQQWAALSGNRNKRHRTGTFLIHGVRPISLAVQHGWPLDAVLHTSGRTLSSWARGVVDGFDGDVFALDDDLLHELGGKDDDVPELIAVGRTRPDELGRIPFPRNGLVLVFDRPTSPGNLGTLIRSADALGADGVAVSGHAADVYDPRTVRASTGSLFAVPTVQGLMAAEVSAWARGVAGDALRIVGTDEGASVRVDSHDFSGPTVLVVGNETAGLSTAWREACTDLVSIPIGGAASSLNAASAGTVVLYEIARQRSALRHVDEA